jgi:hypothetical protein
MNSKTKEQKRALFMALLEKAGPLPISAMTSGEPFRPMWVVNPADRNARLKENYVIEVCQVPPKGWKCSRTPGHDGPCAASPISYEDRKQLQFFDKFPVLFPNGEPICGFSCGEGWFGILDKLFTDLIQLIGSDPENAFVIDQVKEKFGSLRCYPSPINDSIYKKAYALITKAESESSSICEDCGMPGKKNITKWGFIYTRCEPCKVEFLKI